MTLELLSIPLLAGFVGYVTNVIAIRMLFRPFKPKWYTLGWQGIIPRTRDKLARNVGIAVGEKLVTAEEIDKTLSNPQMKENIEQTILNALESPNNNKFKDIYESLICSSLNKTLNDPEIARAIDTSAANLLKSALRVFFNIKKNELLKYLKPLGRIDDNPDFRENIYFHIEKALRDNIHNAVNSGKSLSELFPDILDIKSASDKILEQIVPVAGALFKNRDISNSVAEMLVKYKEQQFKDSFTDRMKLATLNMFLYDDRIRELTAEKLPEIGARLETDPNVRKHIREAAEKKLNEFWTTPLGVLAESLGDERYYAALHSMPKYVVRHVVPERLVSHILQIFETDGDEYSTLSEFLTNRGISVDKLVPESLPVSIFFASSKDIKLPNFTLNLSREQMNGISVVAADWLLHILRTLIPHFVKLINISDLVEHKIMSLDLAEVEEILFSFMRSHFKWINILGFVIGFFIGLVQVLGVLAYGR